MTESPDPEIVFRNENQVLGQGDGDSGTETEEQTVDLNLLFVLEAPINSTEAAALA